MGSGYLIYMRDCLDLSFKAALRLADNLIGNVFSAVTSLLLARYTAPWLHDLILTDDVREFIVWLIGIAIFILSYLVLRMVFVAPYELFRRRGMEIENLKNRKRDDENGCIPLQRAIEFVSEESAWGVGRTEGDIIKEILKLAGGKAFKLSGRCKNGSERFADMNFSEVPSAFLKSCKYVQYYDDLRTPALEGLLNGASIVYYFPKVKMSMIERHFDRKK